MIYAVTMHCLHLCLYMLCILFWKKKDFISNLFEIGRKLSHKSQQILLNFRVNSPNVDSKLKFSILVLYKKVKGNAFDYRLCILLKYSVFHILLLWMLLENTFGFFEK